MIKLNNRYHLMRHGQSTANVADLIVSLPEHGLEDYGLSALGRHQAQESAQACGLGPDTLIVTSDFLRARQTAQIAATALGATSVQTDAGLRERAFGQLEGKTGDGYQQVWAVDAKDSDNTHLGAESPNALVARLRAVLDKLESAHQNRDILLVSHGDPLRFLQLWAIGRPLSEHLQLALFQPAEIRPLSPESA